jgi:hypothetical protein
MDKRIQIRNTLHNGRVLAVHGADPGSYDFAIKTGQLIPKQPKFIYPGAGLRKMGTT